MRLSHPRFCEPFGLQILHRIRRLHIRVRASARDHPDAKDLVEEVEGVCLLLRTIPRIRSLHVVYQAWNTYIKTPLPSTVVKPFNTLNNFNDVEIESSVDEVAKSELESVLQDSYNRNLVNYLPSMHGKGK